MIYDLEKRLRISLGPAVLEGRCQIHQQHRHGKNDRTDEKRDVTLMKRCQKENRRTDDRTHKPDPMADTIRYFLAGRLRPLPQRQGLVNSIQRHGIMQRIFERICQTKMVACGALRRLAVG